MKIRSLAACALAILACWKPPAREAPAPRLSILLVTLDTTRADAMGDATPAFLALAKRGLRFQRAYSTVPETLPAHTSMLTGLYPAAHGIHENARRVSDRQTLLAERLRDAGYRTAAFISGYPLERRFGLARGFDHYDDDLGGKTERRANETADRAIAFLRESGDGPLLLWVHFFDPHHPYEPTEPFRSRYPGDPYRSEVAAMDEQVGRVVAAFEERFRERAAIVVAGDHGESLGEHGEAQHGNLLYEGAMRVPLAIAGPGIAPRVREMPVSIRRVYHTILDLAGLGAEGSLRRGLTEVVAGEAMKPFLSFGWQPQVMAVEGRSKVIRAGTIEVYDVVADPSESRNLAQTAALSRGVRQTIRDYPLPSPASQRPAENLTEEERKQLASLGYVSSDARPVVRADAPRPADMVHLFDDLDRASALFVQEKYREAIPIFERILAVDPTNLMTLLRLAAAHSVSGHSAKALEAFARAERLAPDSSDVRHYLAMHYMRTGEWQRAAPLLERVLAETPDRLPALEALATVREREGRVEDALLLWQKIRAIRPPAAAEWLRIGSLAMAARQTPLAIEAFEAARALQADAFRNDLELGVLYLDQRRLEEARAALDRVSSSHPAYPMALFKRAQVSVLLGEADRDARIALARRHADATTRRLIEKETLFRN